MCWFCHWGWPEPIANIYLKAVADLREIDGNLSPLHFGPAHIVWEDCNFDCAQWCIDNFDEYRGDYTDAELAIVMRSLHELLEVEDRLKDSPTGLGHTYPEEVKPWPGVKMIKIT